MTLAGVEPETLVSEPHALTTRPMYCKVLVTSFKSNNMITETNKIRDRCKRATLIECRAHHIPQTPALYIDQEFETLLENKIKTHYNSHTVKTSNKTRFNAYCRRTLRNSAKRNAIKLWKASWNVIDSSSNLKSAENPITLQILPKWHRSSQCT